jgi:MFS family permease
VFLATGTLGGGEASAGLLLAAVGIGLLIGYALLARPHPQVARGTLLVAGFAISSAGNLLTGLAWAVAAAFVMQTVRGLGIAAMDVAVTTLLQRSVPRDLLGRVFGSLYGAIGIAAALAYLLGGLPPAWPAPMPDPENAAGATRPDRPRRPPGRLPRQSRWRPHHGRV